VRSKAAFALLPLLLVLVFPVTAHLKTATVAPKPKLAIATLEHSFGNVKPGTPLNYTFKVENQGDSNLEITNVSPSCGCTTSNFDKVVAPGKSGGITLAVEKTESYKGEVTKTATVTTNDPERPSFTLTLRANFTAE
jgi:hypothetical protein